MSKERTHAYTHIHRENVISASQWGPREESEDREWNSPRVVLERTRRIVGGQGALGRLLNNRVIIHQGIGREQLVPVESLSAGDQTEFLEIDLTHAHEHFPIELAVVAPDADLQDIVSVVLLEDESLLDERIECATRRSCSLLFDAGLAFEKIDFHVGS